MQRNRQIKKNSTNQTYSSINNLTIHPENINIKKAICKEIIDNNISKRHINSERKLVIIVQDD